VHARLDHGASLTIGEAREAVRATWTVAGERRRPVLVDLSGLREQSREARLYFVSDEAVALYSAVAILISSPVSRVIGTFFLRLTNHKVPTRLFTSEEEAIAWLVALVPEPAHYASAP